LGVILEDRGFLLLPVNLTEYILKFSNCQATATKAKFEAFVHGHFFRKPATTVRAIPETPTTAFFRPTSAEHTIRKWAIIPLAGMPAERALPTTAIPSVPTGET
jgi:hypothetical protein